MPPMAGLDASSTFDSATFVAASRDLLTSGSSGPAVSKFLRAFPLSVVLAALYRESEPEVQQAALASLQAVLKSKSADVIQELPTFLPNIEIGLFVPSPDLQSLCCLAAQRIGEASRAASEPGTTPRPDATSVALGSGDVSMTSVTMMTSGSAGAPNNVASTGTSSSPAKQLMANKVILRGLLESLSSPSLAVANAASDAIVSLCSVSPDAAPEFFSEPTHSQLLQLLTQPPTQVQQRVITLAIRLASVSEAGSKYVQQIGVLDVLLDMIGGQGYCRSAASGALGTPEGGPSISPPDELSALTACELLTDFLRETASARLVAANPHATGAVLHTLKSFLRPSSSDGAAGLLFPAAWKAAAYLVSPPTIGVPSPLLEPQAKEVAELLARVCVLLESGPGGDELQEPGDISMQDADISGRSADVHIEGPAGWEEAVCEAAAIMSATKAGAGLLLQPTTTKIVSHICKGAYGAFSCTQATPDLQVAAIHALASILGSERGGGHGYSNATVYSPSPGPPLRHEGIELSEDQEEALREAVYYSAVEATGGPRLGGVLYTMLRQGEEVRVAVYRLITVLVERPWGLTEVCGTAALVGQLVDPLSETHKQAMDWRHSCVVAAATAAAAHAAVPPSSELYSLRVAPDVVTKLEEAARMGPYAVRRIIEAMPIVTTDERPPTGF